MNTEVYRITPFICYDLKKLKSLAVIFFNIFHIFSKKSIKWNLK